MKTLTLVALLAGLSTAGALAGQVNVASWSRGVWHVEKFENPDDAGFGSCQVWTGSDGDGVVSISVGEGGGDASFSYEPVTLRGEPSALDSADAVVAKVDGRRLKISDELEVAWIENEFGEWEVSAAAGSARIAGAVRAMRKGDRLDIVLREGGAKRIYESFALNGFTAAWLKAADWCGFDPKKRFRAS